jgi:hypothetical protein
LITLAGFPATIENGGTSLVTTEQAAIIDPFPILTPLRITELIYPYIVLYLELFLKFSILVSGSTLTEECKIAFS